MALSNWDTSALTHEGKSSDGSLRTPLGVNVQFYKNWLYIHDSRAWRKGGPYMKPTVMEMTEGRLSYLDLSVVAIRGPQGGIYAVAWTGYEHDGTLRGIAGAGVYGFDDHAWVGVLPESMAWWRDRLKETRREVLVLDDRRHEYDSPVLDVPDCFRRLEWSGAARFNQGDAYLADRLGGDVPATAPGQAEEPLLTRLLDAATKDSVPEPKPGE